MRKFKGGATRNINDDKYDYEAFLSPLVMEEFAKYMHKHRLQDDDTLRDGDNWQKGIPKEVYMKSAWRHFMDMWKEHRGHKSRDGIKEAMCGLMFNIMGYFHEELREKRKNTIPPTLNKKDPYCSPQTTQNP